MLNMEMQNKLLRCESVFEMLTMFFGLGMPVKTGVFSERIVVPKGTHLYRIRRAGKSIGSDYNNPKYWGPVPKEKATQGRFNAKNESVIYLASEADSILEREVRLKENEEYYLAKYVCENSFEVGSFLGNCGLVNTILHKIAMSVAEEDALTEKEKKMIDHYIEMIGNVSVYDMALDALSPLYLNRYVAKLYDTTNKLGKLVMRNNENGVRYASVYAPIELSGGDTVITLNGKQNGNFALTEKGYSKIVTLFIYNIARGKIHCVCRRAEKKVLNVLFFVEYN